MKYLDVKDIEEEKKYELIDRLNEEVSKIKAMNDPNIVKYIKVEEGKEEVGMIAIAMEYVPGGSIMYLLKFFQSFKEPLVKIYINQVVKALFRLHKNKIVHQDLKTSNLMVDDLGTVKLSDFGWIKSLYKEYCPEKIHCLDESIYEQHRENALMKQDNGNKLENLISGQVEGPTLLKPLVNSYFTCPPEVHNKE